MSSGSIIGERQTIFLGLATLEKIVKPVTPRGNVCNLPEELLRRVLAKERWIKRKNGDTMK
jgi:hypothetical protein